MILWKNVKYNLISRLGKLFKYYFYGGYKSKWKNYYYPHPLPWTLTQLKNRNDKITKARKNLLGEMNETNTKG